MTSTLGPAKRHRRRSTRPKRSTRRLIVAINIAEAAISLPCLIWAYGLAEHLVAAQEAEGPKQVASRVINWWPADFAVTLNMSLLIVGAAAGVVGSVIHQSIAFTRNSGPGDHHFVWWHLLRPPGSALLGSVSVIAVNTGLVSIGDATTSSAGVAVLVLTGCLAGLFTDQVLQRLRNRLDGSSRRTPPASA
ncbi:hypothetical protein GCM10009789_25510 [Kribbella sancticallisti]|uniref:Uncharacterized protein n=1 Tax=Kribbella sancticallisti TaxID=460087 RepID=A0ABP4P1W9_9ACTN